MTFSHKSKQLTGKQLNSHYEEVYQIKGAHGLKVDLHEFHITQDETAVYTVYQVRQVDLSEVGGPVQGWIFDSIFQEVNIETNELLFEWRATDHFTYTESADNRHSDGDSPRHPWDWFHINSIDKDSEGNFLISSRYLNGLAYIHGSSGEVLWQLGGQNNLFDDLSDGAATNISWQHHARFQPQYESSNNTKVISIFDNSSRGKEAPEHPSRGLIVDLDTAKMTASVRAQYWNPIQIISQSQGSMQVLDNGHVLLGYGYDAAWTEFGADGEVLCDVHFGPRVGFGKGAVLSYRVFKQKWIGQPLTLPDVALSGTTASVSWNGATEVVTWVLQGSSVEVEKEVETESEADSESALLADSSDRLEGDGPLKIFRLPPGHHLGDGAIHSRDTDIPDEEFDFISAVPKKGFETKIVIPLGTPYRTLRIIALDKYGVQIGATKGMNWDPEAMNEEVAVYTGDRDDESSSSPSARILMFVLGFMTAAIFAGCVWLARRYSSRLSRAFPSLRRVNNSRDEHKWQAVHSGEELDDLDSFSDLGPEARDEDVLLKEQHHEEA